MHEAAAEDAEAEEKKTKEKTKEKKKEKEKIQKSCWNYFGRLLHIGFHLPFSRLNICFVDHVL